MIIYPLVVNKFPIPSANDMEKKTVFQMVH